jgi:hypothetical protein
MGILIPADYDTRTIEDAKEQQVVENLRDRLSDSWYIIPRLDVANPQHPYEIDILIFHEGWGIAGIEVKGGRLEVKDGEWYRGPHMLSPSPPRQAQDACYELRDKLREHHDCFEYIEIQFSVALPDCDDVGNLTVGIVREQILFQEDLLNTKDRIHKLMLCKSNIRPLTKQQIEEFVALVRPNVKFKWDAEAQARDARVSLNRIMREQVRALSTLDMNNTVFVHGAAGTGKTYLALNWANRALKSGERVLMTCYNEPLADYLSKQFTEEQNIVICAYLKIPEVVEGFPELPVPNPLPRDWWNTAPTEHIKKFAPQLSNKFDTIIVDETQDFNEEWINSLIELHDPNGSQSLLMVGDWQQRIYDRDGKLAVDALGPTEAELVLNCRNSHEIGQLLYNLGGAQVANASPDGQGLYFEYVSDIDSLVHWVGHFLEFLIGNLSHDPRNILVVTRTSAERDAIRNAKPGGYMCSAYEDSQDENIVCETVFRAKGLEFDHVIFATTDANIENNFLYIGLSRAVSTLVVLAPTEVVTDKLRLVRNK